MLRSHLAKLQVPVNWVHNLHSAMTPVTSNCVHSSTHTLKWDTALVLTCVSKVSSMQNTNLNISVDWPHFLPFSARGIIVINSTLSFELQPLDLLKGEELEEGSASGSGGGERGEKEEGLHLVFSTSPLESKVAGDCGVSHTSVPALHHATHTHAHRVSWPIPLLTGRVVTFDNWPLASLSASSAEQERHSVGDQVHWASSGGRSPRGQ